MYLVFASLVPLSHYSKNIIIYHTQDCKHKLHNIGKSYPSILAKFGEYLTMFWDMVLLWARGRKLWKYWFMMLLLIIDKWNFGLEYHYQYRKIFEEKKLFSRNRFELISENSSRLNCRNFNFPKRGKECYIYGDLEQNYDIDLFYLLYHVWRIYWQGWVSVYPQAPAPLPRASNRVNNVNKASCHQMKAVDWSEL